MSSPKAQTIDRAGLQAYLHEKIPLTGAMRVSVEAATPRRVLLRAPLAPNINHQDTAFGGSASALAILAGWTLVHVRMVDLGRSPEGIVIQRNRVEYLRPIHDDFAAECRSPSSEAWSRFLRILERRGRARISLEATLLSGESEGNEWTLAGRFHGDYVTMAERRSG